MWWLKPLGEFVIAVIIVGAIVFGLDKAPIDERIKGIAKWLIIIVALVLAIRWLMGFAG